MKTQMAKVIPIDIEREVKRSFLDYSMSVIVSRALPDVRDGLKPVQRRILYALYEQGMTPDKPHRKSANLVGEVLGKYHPHGDMAVYDAMVRMAQDFSMRYLLVDGHGNFGSIDGDSAAAMRYTEVRMSPIAMEMLADIEKNTVPFRPNYDDSRMEPEVLPARIPNLLINGSSGIAVGMATNIPPHNLGEIVDGLLLLLDKPEADVRDIMKVVKGPDFPTGATIAGTKGIREAYTTGRGSIRIRAKVNIEETKGGRHQIVVTEIPYLVNKARLIERIAELVREKKIEGISDLRDESDRHGIRIVIEVKKEATPKVILNQLFKHTQLEDNFGVTMLALVDGVPQVLNLRQMLSLYLEHRKTVIINRTKHDLELARKRQHVVQGLLVALDHIDEVIEMIRSSKDDQTAKKRLMDALNLSEEQAEAILQMRLRRLTGLERDKLNQEFRHLKERIEDWEDVLARSERVVSIIKEELKEIKEKYQDPRRTEIREAEEVEVDEEDLIQEEMVVITLTDKGYVKRQPLSVYRSQKRGGKGLIGTTTRAEDFATDILVASNLSTLLFFTNKGRAYSAKAYVIPEAGRQAKGTSLANLLTLGAEEKVTTIVAARETQEEVNLLMVTKKGLVKKVAINEFRKIRKNGIIAINLQDGDELVCVMKVNPQDKVILVSRQGMAIVFSEQDLRVMGRTAAGVKGIRLSDQDEVIDADKYEEGSDLFLTTENGFGKRTPLNQFRLQKRGGRGLIAIKLTAKTGPLVGARVVRALNDEVMLLTVNGIIIRLWAKEISQQGRTSRGVVLMRLDEGDKVISVARFKGETE